MKRRERSGVGFALFAALIVVADLVVLGVVVWLIVEAAQWIGRQ